MQRVGKKSSSGGVGPLVPDPPSPTDQRIEAERIRLLREREACEQDLEALNGELQRLEAERDALPDDPATPAYLQRLRRLAGMGAELRAPLHLILGQLQVLRMDAGLTPAQAMKIDAILEAGTRLLERVHAALSLSDIDSEHVAWPIDTPRPAQNLRLVVPAAASDAPAWRALRVLVVDDSDMSRDIASAFLHASGHDVSTAASGADGVQQAASADFDVILMDVDMPGISGIAATGQIRSLAGPRGRTPIVALTAQAFVEDIENCHKAGMNGHLAKPFRQDTLEAAVLHAAMVADTARSHRSPAWIDIASPWNGTSITARSHRAGGGGAPVSDTQFVLKLKHAGVGRSRCLVDAHLSCAPAPEFAQYEFHWLLHVRPDIDHPGSFTSACDLWRWSRSVWRSVTVPGAQFSPNAMYDDGWRYCGPCQDRSVRVEVEAGGDERTRRLF